MLKKTITYEDFNGKEVSEEFFFHLSKAELVELEMSHKGGMLEWLQNLIKAEDGKTIMEEFKKIILNSYGKKSDDGRRFTKNETLREEFESSEAYSTLFMELVTDAEKASEFVNGIIPAGMAEEVAKLSPSPISAVPEIPTPEPRIVTRKELTEMPKEEFDALGEDIASGKVKIGE